MELLDVVDDENHVTGREPRAEVHRLGLWHRGVHVLLFTPEGCLVVQRRAGDRAQAPNALDCSVSEHLCLGEAYLDAANRGLREELGLVARPLRRLAQLRLDYGPGDNMISEVYEGSVDESELRPDRAEVEGVNCLSLVELQRLLRERRATFCRWFEQVLLWYLRQPSQVQVIDDVRERERRPLLLGTRNPSRVAIVKAALRPLPIDLLTPSDVGVDIEVEEDGRTSEENAERKARAYFAATSMPTLAIDAGLHVEGLPPDKQPGVYVRRAIDRNHRASDEELVEYFAAELARAGGERPGTWHGAMTLMLAPDHLYSGTYDFHAVFTPRRGRPAGPGAPLDALKIDPATGRYFSETPNDERPDLQWLFGFVRLHLDEI